MPKVKIPRKATNIDMTAMCDVAFLLLTFFMLATKFKPEEAVPIVTPNSVASEKIPDKNAMLVSIDKDGKVYVSFSDKSRESVITKVNTAMNLGLTPEEIKTFRKIEGIGVPFNQLKGFLALDDAGRKRVKQEGVPVLDSTKNELTLWVSKAVETFTGSEANFLLKGDNNSKYNVFKSVIESFKKNDQFKFKLITTPEGAPEGTALYLSRMKEINGPDKK
jgi:biopolymer transport protein ExbD